MLPRLYESQDCSLARALEDVGERWTLLVLRDCFFGVRRFTDLQAHLDISRAVLSARLADLVESGLLDRREYAPGRSEYELTEQGRATLLADRKRRDEWLARQLRELTQEERDLLRAAAPIIQTLSERD